MPHIIVPGGVYRNVLASWVGVGGGWKRVTGRWIGVDGVWKQYFDAGTVELLPATVRAFAVSPDIPIARLDFAEDGTITATYTDRTVAASSEVAKWYDPAGVGAGAGFQIRANRISGEAAVTGSLLGTWLNLSTGRSWEVSGGGPFNGGNSASLKVEIRPTGGTQVIAEAVYLLTTVTFDGSYSSGFEGREGGINQPLPRRWDL